MKLIHLSSVLVILLMISCQKNEKTTQKVDYISNSGETQGTTYHITYLQPQAKDLHSLIIKSLNDFDNSLSNYNPNSIISKINQNQEVTIDFLFETMYRQAEEVSKNSDGAFDITVSPLVLAWGFGSENPNREKIPNVKPLMPLIGYQKVKLENHRIIKQNPKIKLDAAAIAQGYSCDVIGDLLLKNGCENYMVEIGGEVMSKGLNPKGEKWKIGIDKPIDDTTGEYHGDLQAIVAISGVALATSGSYHQFYIKNGKKYSHEIDPHTGCPVTHNLLSATVIAPNGALADAYATAFMVLGVDKTLELCKKLKGIECYLIYADNQGKNQIIYTPGFKKYLLEEIQN